ncbi:formaldehyde-sensing protein EfgA-like [Clytia hemisphaerica]|uniref:Uncharacterized protein n=1 Tax=Clytia hemisphaerica TaxID=252671 RepID=A0A7M6DPQ9_9CNID
MEILIFSLLFVGSFATILASLGCDNDITEQQARRGVSAALAKSRDLGVKMCIGVVDAGANLKYFVRMDDSLLGSIDIAIKKAKTARLSNVATEDLGRQSQPGQPLYGIEQTNGGLVTFGGGLPIKCSPDGHVIGAIGVAGDSIENDIAVAKVGADAICKMIKGDNH